MIGRCDKKQYNENNAIKTEEFKKRGQRFISIRKVQLDKIQLNGSG